MKCRENPEVGLEAPRERTPNPDQGRGPEMRRRRALSEEEIGLSRRNQEESPSEVTRGRRDEVTVETVIRKRRAKREETHGQTPKKVERADDLGTALDQEKDQMIQETNGVRRS